MKKIAENFTLAKSSIMEQSAIENIFEFWFNQSQNPTKTPNEALILIINTIADSCKVVPIEEKTSDSDDLMAVHHYLEDIEAQLRGLKPSTITIVSPQWDSCLEALEDIGKQASKDGVDIVKRRLDYFIRTLRKKVNEQIALEEQEYSRGEMQRKGMLILYILGFIFILILAFKTLTM